jgi:hypothetical protein
VPDVKLIWTQSANFGYRLPILPRFLRVQMAAGAPIESELPKGPRASSGSPENKAVDEMQQAPLEDTYQ